LSDVGPKQRTVVLLWRLVRCSDAHARNAACDVRIKLLIVGPLHSSLTLLCSQNMIAADPLMLLPATYQDSRSTTQIWKIDIHTDLANRASQYEHRWHLLAEPAGTG